MQGKFDKERYQRWRKTIPFSDEQVIEAFGVYVAGLPNEFVRKRSQGYLDWFARTRRLNGTILRTLLPYLVKWCGICGKTALYHFGSDGRCKAHRLDKPETIKKLMAQSEVKHHSIRKSKEAFDTRDLARRHRRRDFRVNMTGRK